MQNDGTPDGTDESKDEENYALKTGEIGVDGHRFSIKDIDKEEDAFY